MNCPEPPAPEPEPEAQLPEMDGAIACDETVTGNTVGHDNDVGNAAPDHYYTFTVDTDDADARIVQFDSCGSGFDTYLRVFSPDLDSEITGCDDCGPCGTRTVLDADLAAGD